MIIKFKNFEDFKSQIELLKDTNISSSIYSFSEEAYANIHTSEATKDYIKFKCLVLSSVGIFYFVEKIKKDESKISHDIQTFLNSISNFTKDFIVPKENTIIIN